jgi:hypothetical protein
MGCLMLAATIVAALGTTRSAQASSEPIDLGTLEVGVPLFWEGPVVSGGFADGGYSPGLGVAGSARCVSDAAPPVTVPCVRYVLHLPTGGTRLRVAIDHPSYVDGFGIELRDPSGGVAEDSGEFVIGLPGAASGYPYSGEVFAAPREGEWTLTVLAHNVRDSQFRLRALLEGDATEPTGHVPLMPNLQATPVSEIGFADCYSSEQSNFGAQRCLRFAQGPRNIGEGPVDLVVHELGEPGPDMNGRHTLVGTQWQRIHYADGSVEEVEAGTFEFHFEHWHYHHAFAGDYRLLRADPETQTTTELAAAPKQGFCMGDFMLSDWQSFTAQPRRRETSFVGPNCAIPTPGATQMGLTAGWGDLYTASTEGNYVDFADNPDGLYVITTATNFLNHITESTYEDNHGYSYIRVCGGATQVDVLERGLATGRSTRTRS